MELTFIQEPSAAGRLPIETMPHLDASHPRHHQVGYVALAITSQRGRAEVSNLIPKAPPASVFRGRDPPSNQHNSWCQSFCCVDTTVGVFTSTSCHWPSSFGPLLAPPPLAAVAPAPPPPPLLHHSPKLGHLFKAQEPGCIKVRSSSLDRAANSSAPLTNTDSPPVAAEVRHCKVQNLGRDAEATVDAMTVNVRGETECGRCLALVASCY